jgi:predicted Rossmann-fold nucleotide-binding protein
MAGNRTFAIIGVVGKTYGDNDKVDKKLLNLAEELGGKIAEAGQAVLTGGHHEWSESSVKYRALIGAQKVATRHRPVRLLGVLPKAISEGLEPPVRRVQLEVHSEADDPVRFMYLHTGLKNRERDPITAQSADGMIALTGTGGTAREVAEAIKARRPVVFLNSLSEGLETMIRSELKDVPFPSSPIRATEQWEAVAKVLAAIVGKGLSAMCTIPQIDFESGLQKLKGSEV